MFLNDYWVVWIQANIVCILVFLNVHSHVDGMYILQCIYLCICVLRVIVSAFLARDVIYTSRAYATMSVSVCLTVCL